ncbi:MAG: AAA family ATPase, partial [Candidatus Nanoarchaeia archaeon]
MERMYEVVIGRSESDRKELGLLGTVFLGKLYVKMGAVTSLSNKLYLDVAKAHVILICGKRGTGKCVTGDTLVRMEDGSLEEIKNLEFDKRKVQCVNKEGKIISAEKDDFFKRTVNKILKLKLSCGKEIKLTPEHPLLTEKGWKPAKELGEGVLIAHAVEKEIEINDKSTTLIEKELILAWNEIKSIEEINGEIEVYDISVPEFHNFVANDVIIHNSYTLGVIAEEMANLPEEISHRLSVLIIDTMGIFWTMKFKNEKDEELLDQWELPKKALDVRIYTPAGKFEEYKAKGIPADIPFTIKPSELGAEDWTGLFGVSLLDPLGILIERSVEKARDQFDTEFEIEDIVKLVQSDERADQQTKNAVENRFLATKSWGIFSKDATELKQIVEGGRVSILDISVYTEWTIKTLVVGILCKKLMRERMAARKIEELKDVERGHSYFRSTVEKTEGELPIVWILIDEFHNFMSAEGKTLATDSLISILREGRQPGVCLVMATQQPGQLHSDVLTQTDIVICHRITARRDVEALNSMMQSYVTGDIQKFLNNLPAERGAGVILDDNSERLYPVRVRPRFTWHGGEAPTAVKAKGKAALELGL